MKMNLITYIILLFIIPFINSEIKFTITGVEDMQTMCDRQKGFFQFVIKGQASGISSKTNIIFPLKSPETCKAAECIVDSEKMFCIMDANKYDLSGEKKVEVYEDEPEIDNFKFTNWKEYFRVENRIINDAKNCIPDGKKPVGPDDGEDNDKQIFAMFKSQIFK